MPRFWDKYFTDLYQLYFSSTICSEPWEMCLHIVGREDQAALNPVFNKRASFLNCSTHSRGYKSRNRNNIELVLSNKFIVEDKPLWSLRKLVMRSGPHNIFKTNKCGIHVPTPLPWEGAAVGIDMPWRKHLRP